MDERTAEVSESKFNGTATLDVAVPESEYSKQDAKRVAEEYFKDVHGSSPSKVVAEEYLQLPTEDKDRWTVMVADHSSGSLADSRQYEI